MVFGVYRQQVPLESTLDEILHQGIANAAAAFTRAHHRHLARLEDTIQIVLTHMTISPFLPTLGQKYFRFAGERAENWLIVPFWEG
jgi:hypothetical protein